MSKKATKKTEHTTLRTQFEHLKKQVHKEYIDFKKSVQKNIKKPQSRVAEFVILFLVVGILFSLFSLVDGLLQAYIKAFEKEEATIEAYFEKDEEDCETGEVTYNLMAKIGESDNNTVRVKGYELSYNADNFGEITEDEVDFKIGDDEDELSKFDENIIRGALRDDEHVMTEGGEADTFFALTLEKEDYEGSAVSTCHMQYVDEQRDYTEFLDDIQDGYDSDSGYIAFVADTIIEGLPNDVVEEHASDIVNNSDFADDPVVGALRGEEENEDEEETDEIEVTAGSVRDAVDEQNNANDVTPFVAELLDRVVKDNEEDLEELAEQNESDHADDYSVEVKTGSSAFYSRQLDQNDEFEIVELEVVGKGQGGGGSDSEDGDSGGGSGSDDDEASGGGRSGSGGNDEGSGSGESDGGKGTGSGYECKERPEKGDSPEGVCGCVGEDCGFGSSDDNRYDWRCCHRAWGPCEQDGKRACITVFGEGKPHACEVGQVEECVPQSQVDEVQDRKDQLRCEGEPPNIAQPADAAGKPQCFMRDGDDWITCSINDDCEKVNANWCYGGYCGKN